MKNINMWLKGGLLGLLAAVGMASCSDDHFDINSTNPSGTLWENLEAVDEASDFREILEKTIVNKKSYGVPATINYKQLLSSSRVFTVWAPKNGTFDKKVYLDSLAAGNNEFVEKQFVRNHIANYNYNGAYPIVKNVMLYNKKYAEYNVPNNTFKGVEISSDPKYKNMACSNGTVHLLEGTAPYLPSIREIINSHADLALLRAYIQGQDTLEFIERNSTPGSTVDGEIQYVDSYFVESNKILPSIAMNEDSLSAALLPSDSAFKEAWNKISPYFNYKDVYSYYDADQSKWFTTDSVKKDSLQELYTMRVLFYNMFYSLHEQVGFDVENATPESVQQFFNTADSLVSTTYYNSTYEYHQHAPECRELAEGKLPIEGSNGYAFVTDHFNFSATKAWQYDIILEAENTTYFNAENSKYINTANPKGVRHTITDGNRNDSVMGHVHGLAYQEFMSGSKSQKPTVAFNLPNVLSGTYDIYAVIVPENITDASNTNPKYNQFSATLEYDYDAKGKASSISRGTGKKGDIEAFMSNPTKVDTILLFENFKFPYCYAHISQCYPLLSLTTVMSTKDKQVTPYLNIDCFILKGKDETNSVSSQDEE